MSHSRDNNQCISSLYSIMQLLRKILHCKNIVCILEYMCCTSQTICSSLHDDAIYSSEEGILRLLHPVRVSIVLPAMNDENGVIASVVLWTDKQIN